MRPYFNRLYFFTGLFLIFFIPALKLHAEGIKIFQSAKSESETKEIIEKVLVEIDGKRFKKHEETMGFSYLYKNRWTSPFKYAVYIGPIKTDSPETMVRIEGTQGDAFMLDHILSLNGLNKNYVSKSNEKLLNKKNHFIAQGMNIYAPWAAVIYNGFHSPRMTRRQTFSRFLFYIIADVFVIYAGGTNWFQEKFDANAYRGNIAAGLLLVRALGSIQTFNLTRGHNRIVELKYTFPYK